MELMQSQLIPVSRQAVWEALNDPLVLKACIQGCESLERVSDTEYAVAITAAIGPVKARFKGKLLLADLDPPHSYTLSFDGQGGVAGFGKGSAKVSLHQEGAGTRLDYAVKAQVGGRIAQVGSRLIDAAAKKMADDFFAAFNRQLAPPAVAAAVAAAEEKPGMSPLAWGAIVVAGLLLMVYWLTR